MKSTSTLMWSTTTQTIAWLETQVNKLVIHITKSELMEETYQCHIQVGCPMLRIYNICMHDHLLKLIGQRMKLKMKFEFFKKIEGVDHCANYKREVSKIANQIN